MSKFAAFYMFSEKSSMMALHRLRSIRSMNHNVTFIPVVGVRQFFYLPMVVDQFMFGSFRKLPLVGAVSHTINLLASSAPGVFRLSEAISKKVVDFTGPNRLAELRARLSHEELQTLQIDFTPMAPLEFGSCNHAMVQ
jgi:hypothetical protein